MLKLILGILLIITGIFDSYKYMWQAQKIRKVKSAKGQSRKFVNVAILNDVIRIFYCLIIQDVFILSTSVLAFICMIYLFVITYLYYPYRKRGLINFKRPNIILYMINSLLPNSIRKRL